MGRVSVDGSLTAYFTLSTQSSSLWAVWTIQAIPSSRLCPRFSQDRVNFHQNPGRDTARRLTPPGQTEQGIPYRVLSCWVPVGGSWVTELTRGSGARGAGPVWESGFLCCAVCVVFSPDLYHRCYCFPLFAVVLNCPYPDPPVSASFFPFSSSPRWGEGRPCGAFVAGRSQTRTACLFICYAVR